MNTFDVRIRRKDEFLARTGSQYRCVVTDSERPRSAGRKTGTSRDPPDQGRLSKIGQGALAARHATSVERVTQSRFDACAGPGDDVLTVFLSALGFQPIGSTST